ncbi:MAG: hypothetical protein HKO09_03340, partial [Croceitalea sp.]|nr:hypothetical protein [Croceitalea sp.]
VMDFAGDAAESLGSLNEAYYEYIRIRALLGSDIRIVMNANLKGKNIGVRSPGLDEQGQEVPRFGLWSYRNDRDAVLTAEFDWQNLATKLRFQEESSLHSVGIGVELPNHFEGQKDITMYIDAQGNWYVPNQIPGARDYLQIDPVGASQRIGQDLDINLNAAIEVTIDEWFPPNRFRNRNFFRELRELANNNAAQAGFFPAFIHFAFIITPSVARNQFSVQEELKTWRGMEKCTKMVITSGRDAGYQIVFDSYGRLIHLRDKDGDTADYWYDQDVTVNIPPAYYIPLGGIGGINSPRD